jgi:hypothetical protein
MAGSWLPTTDVISGGVAVRASWSARDEPEAHDVRRISDLLAVCLTDGQAAADALRLSADPVLVSVVCDDADRAARVVEVGERLGAEVLQERADLPPGAVLVLKLIWADSDLTGESTLLAVADFLRQSP